MNAVNPIIRDELFSAAQIGVAATARLEAVSRGRDDLLTFARLTSPDVTTPDDSTRSRYTVKEHHRLLASVLTAMEMGLMPRVIFVMPPRHGKSELVTRKFLPWTIGRNPYQHIMLGTYNDTFAEDFGRDVRRCMKMPVYQQIFPGVRLDHNSQAAERLQTTHGGAIFFVGRGGTITGRGADKMMLDDPIKDREEASSPTTRNKTWEWFTDVVMSRLMDDTSTIMITVTRWHDDDLVGRLTDPRNAHYDAELAKKWKVIVLPALAVDNDPLDRAPGAALWPEKFSRSYLEDMRRLNPESFTALWQGRPSLAEGSFFTRDMLRPYTRDQLPSSLRLYGASDHATSTHQRNDRTCMGLVGIDPAGECWVLPELFWRRSNTAGVVDGMLQFFKRQPVLWWAEKDQIFKSIEPFLRQRMHETGIYAAIHQLTSTKDLVARAQPIQGRMSMGKVHLPRFATWYQDAVDELMSFDTGPHDDFVSFMSLIGRGLQLQIPATPSRMAFGGAKPGTFGFLKRVSAVNEAREAARRTGGF